MSNVSRRMQLVRRELGLSRYQAAGHLGMAERRVGQNESGEARVLWEDLASAARLSGVSEAWLRGRPSLTHNAGADRAVD